MGGVKTDYTISTELQYGRMQKFWKWIVVLVAQL